MFIVHYFILFTTCALYTMDQNTQYSFSNNIVYKQPIIRKVEENSDASVKELCEISKKLYF